MNIITAEETFLGGNIFLHNQELEMLYERLIVDDSSLVCIYGRAGVGKTALAMNFKFTYEELFPGGISYLYPHSVSSLFESAVKSVEDVTKSSLIVIDEAHSSKKLDKEISSILTSLPKTKIILVSQTKLRLSFPYKQVELKTNYRDYNRLLEQLFTNTTLTQKVIADLYRVTKGNLSSIEAVASYLRNSRIDQSMIMDLFKPIETPGIIGIDGKPLSVGSGQHKQITTEIKFVSNELLDTLRRNPEELYSLTPRKFEEVVAEILNRLGYDVTLTSESRDGGKDIYAAKKDSLGSFLYVVECKKYAPTNGVGIGVIQRLHGVVQAEKATAGIVATTSYFTRDSKRFQENCSHQMTLQDYFGLINWLNQIRV